MSKHSPKSKKVREHVPRGVQPYDLGRDRTPGTSLNRKATSPGKHGTDKPRSENSKAGTDTLWIFGRHASLAAAANPRRHVQRLLALSNQTQELTAAADLAGQPRPAVEVVDLHNLSTILPPGTRHQGFAVLTAPLSSIFLEDILELHANEPQQLLIVLDQATDPRNVGAVLRSAAAFAASAVILQDRHAPQESGALAKAASGALESVPLVRVTNIARALRSIRDQAIDCIGLDQSAGKVLGDLPLPNRLALVIGAEGSGLRHLVRETCGALVRIPIAAKVESLNLSVAASLAMFAYRQGRS